MWWWLTNISPNLPCQAQNLLTAHRPLILHNNTYKHRQRVCNVTNQTFNKGVLAKYLHIPLYVLQGLSQQACSFTGLIIYSPEWLHPYWMLVSLVIVTKWWKTIIGVPVFSLRVRQTSASNMEYGWDCFFIRGHHHPGICKYAPLPAINAQNNRSIFSCLQPGQRHYPGFTCSACSGN